MVRTVRFPRKQASAGEQPLIDGGVWSRGAAAFALFGAILSLCVAVLGSAIRILGGLGGQGGYNGACSAWIAAVHGIFSALVAWGLLRLGHSHRGSAARVLLASYLFVSGLTALELVAGIRYPRVPRTPSAFESVPYVGWQLKANFEGRYDGLPLLTNADGFRSPTVQQPKPPDRIRMICLGDSLTFGQGSSEEGSYPRVLERELRERFPSTTWEVVNTGVPGYCTFQETHQLRRCLDLAYDPDLVILLVCLNDVTEKYLALRAFGGTGVGFQGVPDGAGGVLFRAVAELRHYSALLAALTPSRAQAERREAYAVEALWERPESAAIEKAWRQQEDELDELVSLTQARGIGLLVAVAPYRSQWQDPSRKTLPQHRLAEYARERQVAFLDLVPDLARAAASRGVAPTSFYVDGSHLTADGNEVVARAILEKMVAAVGMESDPLAVDNEDGSTGRHDSTNDPDETTIWLAALERLQPRMTERQP